MNISTSSERQSHAKVSTELARNKVMPLERVKAPVRQHNAPLYDWDELVQEERVHRLIYTDPAVFDI
jgi:hypothetical protein